MQSARLASIDILRGLTLFLLVFFQPVIMSVGQAANCEWILYNFDHEKWQGFRLWDLVMPMFMFLSGASLPFSLSKYKGRPRAAIFKVTKRFLALFLLGMVVQGNILSLRLDEIRIYVNTLQAIGAGGLIASMVILADDRIAVRWVAIATLLVAYWIPMALHGDYSQGGSFAYMVDEAILGRFRGDLSYTWMWSSLNFGATVLLGSVAGSIMKRAEEKDRIALQLLLTGVSCIAAGLLWGLQMPIIKRLWTSSMVLYSCGICFVITGVFYWWIDARGHTRGLNWLKIYGMNSITAYMLGELVNFRSAGESLLFGFEQYIPNYYPALITFSSCSVVFLILFLMYRNRIFLKI